MKRARAEVAALAHAALSQLGLERSVDSIEGMLATPKERAHGDVALACFPFAKELGDAPPKISQRLAAAIEPKLTASELIGAVEIAGPFLNFRVDRARLAALVVPAILDGSWTRPRDRRGERVMIEYSQPNTHKAFHVGHTRNVALGDAVCRLTEWAGFDVVAANYFGDEGTHVAKCLWYLREHFDGEIPTERRGEFLGQLYVEATRLLDFKELTRAPFPGVLAASVTKVEPHRQNAEWKVVDLDLGDRTTRVVCGGTGYAVGDLVGHAPPGIRFGGRDVRATDMQGVTSEGFIASEAELGWGRDRQQIAKLPADTDVGARLTEALRIEGALPSDADVEAVMRERQEGVAAVLARLENGDPEITELWQTTREWSLSEFRTIYDWLGARFDHEFFESEVGGDGKQIVLDGLEAGTFVKSEGAVGADLDAFGLPFFLLLKSNGTGLYSTKDLALAKRKFDEFKIDRSVYVVDFSQSLHFKQVFKTLELLGYSQSDRCFHLAYGMVVLPEGKMSSRRGNVILFSELEERLSQKILGDYLESKRGDWPDEEIDQATRRIAVATIRYGMLNQDPVKNIVFDLDEWTSKTGNTGPYLLYAYTRTRSVLREVGDRDFSDLDGALLEHELEHEVLRLLAEFPELAEGCGETYDAQPLCIYLYDLAKSYSRMYDQCSVKKASSESLQTARLALGVATGEVLRRGLGLLGIDVLERM